MAQTLVFNDIEVELQIDTSTGTNDLLITGEPGQRVADAIRRLKEQIPALKKVVWDNPGGGIVGRLGVWADSTPRILYLSFSNLTLPSPNFYYTFVNGEWTKAELGYIDKLKDALLSFNSSHTLTAVDGFCPAPPSDPLWNNLVHAYSVEESSGTRYDHRGVVHLAPTGSPTVTSGKLNNAISFGAASTYISSTGAAFPFSTSSWSFSAWVKLSASQTLPIHLFGKQNGTFPTKVYTDGGVGGVYFGAMSGGTGHLYGSATYPYNTFHHIVLVYENAGLYPNRFYINGDQVVLFNEQTIDGTELSIGPSTVSAVTGTIAIDEAYLFNTNLTDPQILQLYNSGIGRFF